MGKSQSQTTNIKDLEIDPRVSDRGSPPPQYIDLDTLRNADGIIAILSQRIGNRAITFAIFKEFVRDRRTERTSFITSSLRESFQAMVKLVSERIDALEADPRLLESLQRKALEKLSKSDAAHVQRVLSLRPLPGDAR